MHSYFVDLDFNEYWQVFVFIKGQPVMGNSCLNLLSDILGIKVEYAIAAITFYCMWLLSPWVQPVLWMLLHLSL